ncbi:hypothetical protein TA3x_005849 (plasmid) [Tundrisphaera sp. TA3]|uniref:hypothetical protein n=1 Tax=Tundrisphaera sp. TA3 TaxID=3435775 RepID=UPI003EBE1B9C
MPTLKGISGKLGVGFESRRRLFHLLRVPRFSESSMPDDGKKTMDAQRKDEQEATANLCKRLLHDRIIFRKISSQIPLQQQLKIQN